MRKKSRGPKLLPPTIVDPRWLFSRGMRITQLRRKVDSARARFRAYPRGPEYNALFISRLYPLACMHLEQTRADYESHSTNVRYREYWTDAEMAAEHLRQCVPEKDKVNTAFTFISALLIEIGYFDDILQDSMVETVAHSRRSKDIGKVRGRTLKEKALEVRSLIEEELRSGRLKHLTAGASYEYLQKELKRRGYKRGLVSISKHVAEIRKDKRTERYFR